MDVQIRSEKLSDYCAITNVNYEAFLGWHPDNWRVSEPVMVDLLRHGENFDPDLSLIAEIAGEISGHVLFSIYQFIVAGTVQKGAVLAPIAVRPEFQKKGIGAMLIEEGHRRARAKGCTFSLLCGHDTYYPKFGYRTRMFSEAGTKVAVNLQQFNSQAFSTRPVSARDIPDIVKAWKYQHGADALSLFPGEAVNAWFNYGFACRCDMVLKNNKPLGYIRYVRTNPLHVKELLAKSEDIPEILAWLACVQYGRPQGEIHIALPEESLQFLRKHQGFSLQDERAAYTAFMIKVLEQNSPIAQYCDQVENGSLKPGIVVFPSLFDLDDGRTE
jgi:predicted N-acetyltransferase YhbS